MRFTRIPVLVATVAALMLSCGVARADTVGHVFPAMDTAASIPSFSQTANRNDYVILQAWETQKLHSLKAANPNVKVLVYKNLAFSAELPDSHNGGSPSGVLYSEAPDSWFLKNGSGQRFTSEGFGWLWAMDIGNADYQRAWADNVIAEMNSEGWDGVFLDDSNATMKYHYPVAEVAKYPSDATYSAAMGSALAYIGPKIRAAGKLAVPNFAAWVEAPTVYNSWLQYVDGALDEMFCKWGRGDGEGYRREPEWNLQLKEAKFAAAQGKDFIAYTQGAPGETQAARFGYATVLLASNGNASYAFTPEYATENWMPEYEYALGAPLAAESRDSNGVHRRAFANGLVLVNPTSSIQSADFEGTYSGSGLTNATAATLAPHSALVLTGTAAPQEKVSTIKLFTSAQSGKVSLRWTVDKRVRQYKIFRNGKPVETTSGRRSVEAGLRNGRLYRYKVVGLDRRGRVVARSMPKQVRPGASAVALAQRSKVS
ncbi:MAG TPA: putative glycoside hydrolase [Solirubrobacterales bacterium]|jgi:hypothetical protein|nr:putative glycoside hydrolase [Solirubrobacterales bacterium]